MQIYNRADIVNFLKVDNTYKRMVGFTDGGRTLNASTYDRRYIDEKIERSDVTGYSTEIAYAFDRIVDDDIHELLAKVHDEEQTGVEVEILTVNFNDGSETDGYSAKLRTYTVIPDADGDSTDAYTYSGTFKASSEITAKTAKSTDSWKTATVQ